MVIFDAADRFPLSSSAIAASSFSASSVSLLPSAAAMGATATAVSLPMLVGRLGGVHSPQVARHARFVKKPTIYALRVILYMLGMFAILIVY